MKLGTLKALGHNIADSLASGIGLMIGVYSIDVFGEAAAGSEGYILVDFLNAKTTGSAASKSLHGAIKLYRDALPDFCKKHGVNFKEIRTLQSRFGTDRVYGPHFSVTVESIEGKKSTDQYVGLPGKRLRRHAT